MAEQASPPGTGGGGRRVGIACDGIGDAVAYGGGNGGLGAVGLEEFLGGCEVLAGLGSGFEVLVGLFGVL